MKKWIIGAITLALIVILTITPSMYVEWAELAFIILGIGTISALVDFRESHEEKAISHALNAAAGFAFGWLFCMADLFIDHFLYFRQTGNEGGAYSTLAFKIDEFSDTLFMSSLISMIAVIGIAFAITKIISSSKTKAV